MVTVGDFSVSTAAVVSLLTATLIPFLSALVTRVPSFLTGVVTAVLAIVSGFLAEWAANPDHFDWKAALGTALAAWAIAALTHSKVLKGTAVEAELQARGLIGSGPAAPPEPTPPPAP
jgi:hypothetical protein